MKSAMIQAATDWMLRGLHVLPLAPGGREIAAWLAPNGTSDATRSPDVFREWLSREPDLNLGVALSGGVFGLTVNPQMGGHLALAELEFSNGDLPATFWEWTADSTFCQTIWADARGRNLFFKMPDGCEVGTGALWQDGEVLPGLTAIGTGGFVAVAPSVGANGHKYEAAVRRDVEIADAPGWLTPLLPRYQPTIDGPVDDEVWLHLDLEAGAKLFLEIYAKYGPNRRECLTYLCYQLFHGLVPREQAKELLAGASNVMAGWSKHMEPFDKSAWIEAKLSQVYGRRGKRPGGSLWRLNELAAQGEIQQVERDPK